MADSNDANLSGVERYNTTPTITSAARDTALGFTTARNPEI